jgi:hypothetical protein
MSLVRGAVLSLAVLLASAPAFAQSKDAPSAAKIRQAGEEFDQGAALYKARDFEGAASHFEAADAAAPTPKAIRQAIRARLEAGQGSRAATLSAQALTRYADDEPTVKLSKETIEKLQPLLHKVSVSCASPCLLAVTVGGATRGVPGDANTRWTVYLDPGPTELSASFFGSTKGTRKSVAAKAGGASDLRFEPEEDKKPPPPPPPTDPKETPPDPPKDTPVEPPPSGIHPAFFFIGLAAAAGLGGVTVWSGIDAKTNPGPDEVKRQCAGKGENCQAYQDGLAKEMRTNVLIGASAGTAALSLVVGIFFTNWKGSPKKSGWNHPMPTVTLADRGAAFGARGSF